jgi:hypothetical protein
VNVVLPATDLRGDEDGVQSEEFLLNGIESERVDEGGERAAMFDVGVYSKRGKDGRRSRTKRKSREHTKKVLIDSYLQYASFQRRRGPDIWGQRTPCATWSGEGFKAARNL